MIIEMGFVIIRVQRRSCTRQLFIYLRNNWLMYLFIEGLGGNLSQVGDDWIDSIGGGNVACWICRGPAAGGVRFMSVSCPFHVIPCHSMSSHCCQVDNCLICKLIAVGFSHLLQFLLFLPFLFFAFLLFLSFFRDSFKMLRHFHAVLLRFLVILGQFLPFWCHFSCHFAAILGHFESFSAI